MWKNAGTLATKEKCQREKQAQRLWTQGRWGQLDTGETSGGAGNTQGQEDDLKR